MTAARCELRPDEEFRMISETKAPSTEGFSLDRKSSHSISLTCSWLYVSYVSVMGYHGSWNKLLRSERGEQLVNDVVLI